MSAPVEEPPPSADPEVDGGPVLTPEQEEAVDPRSFLKRTDILVDSALSPAVFVGVNLLAGLKAGAFAALGLAVLIMAYRLIRRQDLTYALGGVVGTGIAVFIAVRTGTTEGFFWPKVLTNGLIGTGLLASVLFKRPAIGFMMEQLLKAPAAWWQHDRVRPAFSEWTLVWASTGFLKSVVYLLLILAGKSGALLGVSVAFGYPLSAFLGFGGYVYIRERLKKLDAPAMDSFRTPVAAPA